MDYIGTKIDIEETTYMIIWSKEIDNERYGYLIDLNNQSQGYFALLVGDNIEYIPIVNKKIVDKLLPLFKEDTDKILEEI